MKILFLDLRGVMSVGPDDEGRLFVASAGPLAALEQVVKEVDGLRLVLISEARNHDLTTGRFGSYLRSIGLRRGIVLPPTPHGAHRGAEIAEWLADHPEVTHFAIADDTTVRGDNGGVHPKQVHINPMIGLSATDADVIIRLLTT
jgi:hypothetical protein